MYLIYSKIYLLLMKSAILVGGQAVIDGVMMRVPGAYATAVRLSDQTIHFQKHQFVSIIEKHQLQKLYFIRGMIHLYESMRIGYSTLDWSALQQEESKTTQSNKIVDIAMTIFSVLLALTLFLFLPIFLTTFFFQEIVNSPLYFNLISGGMRIVIFLTYLISISFLSDVKVLFQYHGAEHKTVYNFESGQNLDVKNAQSFPTQHPRCGTSFVFIIMLITIFTYTIIDSIALLFINELTHFHRILFHITCLPLVAGIGYEVLKLLSKNQNNFICRVFSKPGLWLQNITTNQPTDQQVEVAIYALEKAFGDDIKKYTGNKYTADAIG